LNLTDEDCHSGAICNFGVHFYQGMSYHEVYPPPSSILETPNSATPPTPNTAYQTLNSTLYVFSPQNIVLNYSYYIPIYVGGNANYSGYCDGGYYNASYSTLNSSLENAGSGIKDNVYNVSCYDPDLDLNITGKGHSILNVDWFNVKSESSTFIVTDSPVEYTETKIIDTPSYDEVPGDQPVNYTYYNLYNSPDRFTNNPLIADDGSSLENPFQNGYTITALYPSSSSVNGYVFYEYDKNPK